MDVKQLMQRGRYKSVVAIITKHLQQNPTDAIQYRARGDLYLRMGKPREARMDFDMAVGCPSSAVDLPGRLHCDHDYCRIGITYWMEGHRDLASAFWRYTTDALWRGQVHYSDSAGGVSAGLLLWFAAVHLRCPQDCDHVRRLFEKRAQGKWWAPALKFWPWPLARFFLGELDEEKLLEAVTSTEILRQRELSQAHFAIAVKARELAQYAAYRKHIRLAAQDAAADLEAEYHLASFEVKSFSKLRR